MPAALKAAKRLSKVNTLKKRSDFLRISKDGKKASTKTFVMLATPNNELRVGYTVSKRTSKLAVERNKIKRRLKAAAREVFAEAVVQDYVIIARRDILERNFKDLKNDLKYALRKLAMQITTNL